MVSSPTEHRRFCGKERGTSLARRLGLFLGRDTGFWGILETQEMTGCEQAFTRAQEKGQPRASFKAANSTGSDRNSRPRHSPRPATPQPTASATLRAESTQERVQVRFTPV